MHVGAVLSSQQRSCGESERHWHVQILILFAHAQNSQRGADCVLNQALLLLRLLVLLLRLHMMWLRLRVLLLLQRMRLRL